jgi:hypothetical protein
MVRRNPSGVPPRLEPRDSVISASSHFVFQVGGNLLVVIAVWVTFAAILGVTGTMGSGWQGRALGVIGLATGVGLFRLGRRLAIENRVMRRVKSGPS